MDRFPQKTKKENPLKHHDKGTSSFAADVKVIKENLKITEILRTVKINSSMRLKAPRGSKVMLSDLGEAHDGEPSAEAGSHALDTNAETTVTSSELPVSENVTLDDLCVGDDKANNSSDDVLDNDIEESLRTFDEVISSASRELDDCEPQSGETSVDVNKTSEASNDTLTILPNIGNGRVARTRKLSLDQTALARESFSQSEVDLHSVGKLPLERKSSFFRKKMESFLKNTSEVFRRQSIKRRVSMSYSMQSLNENSVYSGKYESPTGSQDLHGSITSLDSTVAGSTSSLSQTGSQRLVGSQSQLGNQSQLGSQSQLSPSSPLDSQPAAAESAHSLNEALLAEAMLNSRAISMSSGLDSAQGTGRRRMANRANRVTWLASEGLTNYLRRIIQDEKRARESPASRESKSRRLSYQRAVSGEDPRPPEPARRRSQMPEQTNVELTSILNEFTRSGVPTLRWFNLLHIGEEAHSSLHWSDFPNELINQLNGAWSNLPPNEESRQTVVLELITTEVDYIHHLEVIVEVFIATAHAIQDQGKMLGVQTEWLFSNIPDVLNASLYFYENTIFPMVREAVIKKTTFNTDLMYQGFFQFHDIFSPYEKLLSDQSRMISYLRSLNANEDFKLYLSWCHAQKACNRLQLADLLVKPMQRLTKYSILLSRVMLHTEAEPERTNLAAMKTFADNYVLDLNRAIRQRDDLVRMDELAEMIDAFEIDFKDDDMDRLFRAYSGLNLRAPMLNCLPNHSRSLVYEGDIKFRDAGKDTKLKAFGMDVRAFLLTDMLLLCKKTHAKGGATYKLIRPKYMIDKMVHFLQLSKSSPNKTMVGILVLMADEVGSAYTCFTLGDPSKEGNPEYLKYLQTWEAKIREAKLSYDMSVNYAQDPSRDLSDVELDSSSENARKMMELASALTHAQTAPLPEHVVLCTHPACPERPSADDLQIERDARERVAAMLHRTIDGNSATASQDEPFSARSLYRSGSSMEHHVPYKKTDEGLTSITVNVVSESESETQVTPMKLPLVAPLGSRRSVSRSPSTTKQHTLMVLQHTGAMALVHSLPDLTVEPYRGCQSPQPRTRSPSPQSASHKLYQSHYELLHRNRLSSSSHGHYLHPDHRGKSYPPPSPKSRSMQRGIAFQQSFKYPRLSKMGRVNSQSQLPSTATTSTSRESLKSNKSQEEEKPFKDEKVEEKAKKKLKTKTAKAKLTEGKAGKSTKKSKAEKSKEMESAKLRKRNENSESEAKADEPEATADKAASNIQPAADRHGLTKAKQPEKMGFFDRLRSRGKSEEMEPGIVNPHLVPGTSKEDPPQPPPGLSTSRSLKSIMPGSKGDKGSSKTPLEDED